MEWISIEEALPAPGQIVIAYYRWSETQMGYYAVELVKPNGERWNGFDDVTHWLPLPEPPTEEGV